MGGDQGAPPSDAVIAARRHDHPPPRGRARPPALVRPPAPRPVRRRAARGQGGRRPRRRSSTPASWSTRPAARRRRVKAAVLGPGGVGGLVAAALARARDARPPWWRARGDGRGASPRRHPRAQRRAWATSPRGPRRRPRSPSRSTSLFVATKATALDAALERVEAEPALVVPLLNGLDHVALLRAALRSARVRGGDIRVESDRRAPGEIVQTSPFLRVDLAADDPALRARLAPVADAAGAPPASRRGSATSEAAGAVEQARAAVTRWPARPRAYGLPLGEIRSDPERRAALERAVREAIAVARAEGAGPRRRRHARRARGGAPGAESLDGARRRRRPRDRARRDRGRGAARRRPPRPGVPDRGGSGGADPRARGGPREPARRRSPRSAPRAPGTR